MEMILQSNSWDCLPSSFAMCLDVLPKEIYEFIGHDGSEILWPNLDEPYRRRAFHIDEMIDFAIALIYYPVMIAREPLYAPHPPCVDDHDWLCNNELPSLWNAYGCADKAEERFLHHLSKGNAVLLGQTKSGKPHAVAWCCSEARVFDPEGFKYPLEEFKAEIAYLIH